MSDRKAGRRGFVSVSCKSQSRVSNHASALMNAACRRSVVDGRPVPPVFADQGGLQRGGAAMPITVRTVGPSCSSVMQAALGGVG